MILRADAVVLSKTADFVERKEGNGNYLGVGNLVINCTSVYNTLTRRAIDTLGGYIAAISGILNLMQESGLHHGL